MKMYAVRDWEKHFETAESRKIERTRWVPIKNSHDGLGYRTLLRAPDGPAMFGCWIAILQEASKSEKSHRGQLIRNGIPLTPEDLALLTDMPLELIEKTLEMCVNPRIGWLEVFDLADLSGSNPDESGSDPDRSGSDPGQPARMEGTEGTDRKEGRNAPTLLPPAKTPAPAQVSLSLPPAVEVVKGAELRIPRELKCPEFVQALAFYAQHLEQKGEIPTSFEWETLLLECQKAGIPRSIRVIDYTLSRRAKRLIWSDTPANYRPTRCRIPAETRATGTAIVEPKGFREWLWKMYPQQKGKKLADIPERYRAGILQEFHTAQQSAAA